MTHGDMEENVSGCFFSEHSVFIYLFILFNYFCLLIITYSFLFICFLIYLSMLVIINQSACKVAPCTAPSLITQHTFAVLLN